MTRNFLEHAIVLSLVAQGLTTPTNVRVIPCTQGSPMIICQTPLRGPQLITQPAGSVTINPGDNIQSAITANSNGTTFWLKKGVHPISASLVPKTGNSFVGELGAVLDGTGWSSADNDDAVFRAVNNGITGVTIKNLVLRYGPQYGVNAYLTAADWVVDHNEIHHFKNGVSVGIRGIVSNNVIHHNIGILDDPNPANRGGGYTFNSSIGMKFINNEVAYNGQEQKWIYGTLNEPSQDLTITDNYFHRNVKDGLWIDGDGARSIVERNLCEYNGRTGITIEIATTITVRNNTVRRSVEEGILISASRDSLIVGNTVEDNAGGIALFLDFARLSESYPFWTVDLTGNTIRDNRVATSTGQKTALLTFTGTGDQTPYLNNTKNNNYQTNSYFAPDTSSTWFTWNGNKTFAQWQALPQDSSGSITQR